MEIHNSNLNFKGRCAEIKLGQKVCHTIHSNLPCFLPTKLNLISEELINKHNIAIKTFLSLPSFGKYMFYKICSASTQQALNICSSIGNLNYTLGEIRKCYLNKSTPFEKISTLIEELKKGKTSACLESSILSKLILKMNGIKNAELLLLTQKGEEIDHVVCGFNRDRSPLLNIDKRKTIIIDPWLDKVEFAHKYFKENEGELTKYVQIPSKDKVGFVHYYQDITTLTDSEIEKLKLKYPEFVW